MEMHLVTAEPALDELAEPWQALWAADPRAGLFTSWHWQRLWWHHYGMSDALHVLVFRMDADIVGIVPMYRVTLRLYRGFPVRTLRWLGTGGDTSPEDLGMLCTPAHAHQIARLTIEHLLTVPGVHRILLSDLEHDTVLPSAWQQTTLPPGSHRRPVPDTLLRFARLPDSLAGFRQQISRNTHKKIKQRRNRLQRAGEAAFELCRSPEQLDEACQALMRLHKARQASKGCAGGFASERYVAFHRALMHTLHARDELWLATLRLDQAIIAVEYAFCVRSTLYFFQTGFDPAHEALSPGHVLMTWMIEQAIEAGVQRLELLRGDYPYKASYADQLRYSTTIDLMRPGWRAALRSRVDRWRNVSVTRPV